MYRDEVELLEGKLINSRLDIKEIPEVEVKKYMKQICLGSCCVNSLMLGSVKGNVGSRV